MSIRTTHVGSLVRPDELIAYMHAIDRGEPIDQAGYRAWLASSVREVVARQRKAGVDGALLGVLRRLLRQGTG